MIKKIIHIADIHIRTVQYHDLYKTQFEKLIEQLKIKLSSYEQNEIRIIITGDLFHNKINISNEQLLLTSWFIKELTKIGVVIIIPGNHDFLENNTQRLDSITPIIEMMDDINVEYYKDSGVYEDSNVKWVVYSLYQHNERPKFKKEDDGKLYVGLFHGPIQGLSTDTGYKFDDAYDRLNFVDLDLLLCGDIHKRQQFELSGSGKAIMVGSLIQQNFGETIKHHGYGIYDINADKYEFYDLHSEQPFMHFSISDIKDIDDEKEQLLNLG
jgi:DNA repair exonuclease SbcCD nuclease subunit